MILATVLASLPARSIGEGDAWADNLNRNLLPVGERESMLANTGITSATAGAAFYNPANLARIGHPSISMTGTTLLSFDVSTEALLVIDGVDQPFDASGFVAIPASLVSTYIVGDWALATSVLVPDTFEVANRSTFEAGGLRVTLLQKSLREDLWLGLSASRAIAGDLYAGVSLFGVQQTTSAFSLFQFVNTATQDASQVVTSIDASVSGLTAVGGVHWQPNAVFGLGVRVQSPLVRIAGSADIFTSEDSGEPGGFSSFERESAPFSGSLPIDVGFGVSFAVVNNVQLLADINFQFGQTYNELLDDDLGDGPVRLENALRGSVAAEIGVTERVSLLGGALFNRSAAPKPEIGGETQENYLGATGGLTFQDGRTRTGIGGFYMRSRGPLIPVGSPPERTVDARSVLLGALLTVAYQLD